MGEETEFRFDEDGKAIKKSAIKGFSKFLWNSHTKEFCGRDGASWGKVSLFYAIFYACLGSFFVGMLAVFMQIMPVDMPTYYGEDGTIASRGLNPALGFRPQIDIEDNLISYNPTVAEDETKGYKKYVRSLQNFLDAKYNNELPEDNLIECKNGETYAEDMKKGKSCKFDQKKIFANSPCTEEKQYSYDTPSPCVLIKLNKLIDFVPVSNASTSFEIKCSPDSAADTDNLKKVTFYSEGDSGFEETEGAGTIQIKYFPFFAQKNYRAPFVWARFETTENVVTNIECRAFAENIDYARVTRRGLTKIVVHIQTA